MSVRLGPFTSGLALVVCLVGCGDDDGAPPHPDGAVVDPVNIIPATRRLDWQPGVPSGIPPVSEVCPADAPTVLDFGAVADGTTDNAPAFQSAIDATPSPTPFTSRRLPPSSAPPPSPGRPPVRTSPTRPTASPPSSAGSTRHRDWLRATDERRSFFSARPVPCERC